MEKPTFGGKQITEKVINNKNDRFTKFERDPLQYMLEAELEKRAQLKDITPEVSMICNL